MNDSQQSLIAPGTRIGPYEVAEKLGAGGMGEVYRGTDTKLQRAVAIKVLPAGFTDSRRHRIYIGKGAYSCLRSKSKPAFWNNSSTVLEGVNSSLVQDFA